MFHQKTEKSHGGVRSRRERAWAGASEVMYAPIMRVDKWVRPCTSICWWRSFACSRELHDWRCWGVTRGGESVGSVMEEKDTGALWVKRWSRRYCCFRVRLTPGRSMLLLRPRWNGVRGGRWEPGSHDFERMIRSPASGEGIHVIFGDERNKFCTFLFYFFN